MKWLASIFPFISFLLAGPQAEARQFNSQIDAKVLESAGLSFPISASFLHLPNFSESIYSSQCKTDSFSLDVQPTHGNEIVSTSLKIRFKGNTPDFEECLRGSTCQKVEAQKEMNGKSRAFKLSGKSFIYSVHILNEGGLSTTGNTTCSSFALNVFAGKRKQLGPPESIWVLNYGKSVVFFDSMQKRVWFRVNFPSGTYLKKGQTVVSDALGRILLYDGSTSLSIDPYLDAAVIVGDKKILKTSWGLGSSAFKDEWDSHSLETLATALGEKSIQSGQVYISGIAAGSKFIDWENIHALLESRPFRVVDLPGEIAAVHEEVSTTGTSLMLATRSADNSMSLSRVSEGYRQVRVSEEGIKTDHRARDFDFIIMENQLYRFTSNGLYQVKKSGEKPTLLRGFKGHLKNQNHALVSRNFVNNICRLTIWSNRSEFFRLLDAALERLPCDPTHSIGVTPWSFSGTMIKRGPALSSMTATTD